MAAPGEPAEARRLRRAVLTALSLFAAAMAVVPPLASHGDYLHDPLFWVFGAGLVLLGGVLALARTGRTGTASHLFVAVAFVLTWAFAFTVHGSGYLVGNFAYATLVIILAVYFLHPRSVLLYAAGNIAGVVAVQETFGLARSDQITSYLYIVLFSALLYVLSQEKEAEHQRRQDAVLRVERLRTDAANRDFQMAMLNRAAHRLHTPLTPVVLRMDALDASARSWGETDRKALLEARRSLGRLQAAVEDFLDTARIIQSPESGMMRTGRVREMVEEAVARFERYRPDRIHIETEAPPELEAPLDRPRVVRLLTALLDNAAEASRKGGPVRIRAGTVGDGLLLEVEDEGSGLDPDQQAALDRFLRGDDPASEAAGLGLLLVRAVAQAHGGTASCSSAGPHQGSRFTVTFPAHPEPAGT